MCTLYLLTLFIDKINGAEQHNISQTPQLLVLNMFDEHLNQQTFNYAEKDIVGILYHWFK